MKTGIVHISKISTECISVARGLNCCETCNRVEVCKLPEAKAGRVMTAKLRIRNRNARIVELQEKNTVDMELIIQEAEGK